MSFSCYRYPVVFYPDPITCSLDILCNMPATRKSKSKAKRSYVSSLVCVCIAVGSSVVSPSLSSAPSLEAEDRYRFSYDFSSLCIMLNVAYRNRKRSASEHENMASELFVYLLFFSSLDLLIRLSSEFVQVSPTKKYRRSAPGSPDFESQPAVVVRYAVSCLLQFTNDVFKVQNMVTNLSGAS